MKFQAAGRCLFIPFLRTKSQMPQTKNRSSETSHKKTNRTNIIATNFVWEQLISNHIPITKIPKFKFENTPPKQWKLDVLKLEKQKWDPSKLILRNKQHKTQMKIWKFPTANHQQKQENENRNLSIQKLYRKNYSISSYSERYQTN